MAHAELPASVFQHCRKFAETKRKLASFPTWIQQQCKHRRPFNYGEMETMLITVMFLREGAFKLRQTEELARVREKIREGIHK